jgi:hypothetical protein
MRLRFVTSPTALSASALADALKGDAGAARLAALHDAVARRPEADWERELLAAARQPPEARVALVNEQLTELDFRLGRWSHVPRACASLATSSAFLLAALTLRANLAAPDALSDDLRAETVRIAVTTAIDIVAIGIAATAFCVAVHLRSRRIVRERLEATDKLVERLEALGDAA